MLKRDMQRKGEEMGRCKAEMTRTKSDLEAVEQNRRDTLDTLTSLSRRLTRRQSDLVSTGGADAQGDIVLDGLQENDADLLKSVVSEVSSLSERSVESQRKIEEQAATIKRLEEESRQRIAQLENEKEGHREKARQLSCTLEERQCQLDSLQRELERTRKEGDFAKKSSQKEVEEVRRVMNERVSRLESDCETSNREKDELSVKISTMEKAQRETEWQKAQLQRECEYAKAETQQKEKEIMALREQSQGTQRDVETARQTIQKLTLEMNKAEEEIRKANKERDARAERNKSTMCECREHLREEVESMQKILDKYEWGINSLKRAHSCEAEHKVLLRGLMQRVEPMGNNMRQLIAAVDLGASQFGVPEIQRSKLRSYTENLWQNNYTPPYDVFHERYHVALKDILGQVREAVEQLCGTTEPDKVSFPQPPFKVSWGKLTRTWKKQYAEITKKKKAEQQQSRGKKKADVDRTTLNQGEEGKGSNPADGMDLSFRSLMGRSGQAAAKLPAKEPGQNAETTSDKNQSGQKKRKKEKKQTDIKGYFTTKNDTAMTLMEVETEDEIEIIPTNPKP